MQHDHSQLLGLQDEILLRCLAGAGCGGLCAAAVACRRLATLKVWLQELSPASAARCLPRRSSVPTLTSARAPFH
jgi:hypothetical protein